MDAANALSRLQQIYGGEADFTRPTADNTDNILTGITLVTLFYNAEILASIFIPITEHDDNQS